MAVAQGYGKTVTSGSVFAYDTGDTVNSFKGQPTTNIGNNFRDFTGTGYSPDGEWTSNPTSFTKTYYPNLATPIGPGGTLIEESGTAGFHHLSRYGGGSESGAHCLSCYIYPLVSGITDFCIGLLGDGGNTIQFNLDTKTITYNSGISNRNAFIKDVPGYPGWLRVGANFEGRGGGWVGCLGYSSYTSYTGTAGGKKAYITGIQYEYTTQPTPFVAGTRSATQGLLPVVGNSTIDLSNVSFDSNAQMTFDGTNDLVDITTNFGTLNAYTFEYVAYANSGGNMPIASRTNTNFYKYGAYSWRYTHGGVGGEFYHNTGNETGWSHWVITYDGSTISVWENGISKGTASSSGTADFSGGIRIGSWASSAAYTWDGTIPVVRIYNRALSAAEVKQNFNFYNARFGIEADTYYFVVSNRFSRSLWFSNGYTKVIADTTPAYILYQKPDATIGQVNTYTEVASDPVGSPAKYNVFGNQYAYGSGRFLTTVTVHKSRKDGKLNFIFPDGRTSTYGEAFYEGIVTPYVP
jgi:hypothetical protein